jgi:hypothetical protein
MSRSLSDRSWWVHAYSRALEEFNLLSVTSIIVTVRIHLEMHTAEYLLTHGAEPFLRSCQLCSYSRIFQHFMEPEGLLPYSQEPLIGLYSEPDQSNPSHPISLRSILILPTYLRPGLPRGLLSSGFPNNILYAFFPPFVLHALPISSSLT